MTTTATSAPSSSGGHMGASQAPPCFASTIMSASMRLVWACLHGADGDRRILQHRCLKSRMVTTSRSTGVRMPRHPCEPAIDSSCCRGPAADQRVLEAEHTHACDGGENRRTQGAFVCDQVSASSPRLPLQEEKEALDDLSTELELADEDEPVLYVTFFSSYIPSG
jgi:hypothetical protein